METVDWKDYAAMRTIRLDSKLQYGDFTPGHRVFGRAPKLPIGAVAGPHFRDFTNTNDAPVTQPHALLVKLGGIKRASIEGDFRGKFYLSLRSSFQVQKTDGCFRWRTAYFDQKRVK